MDVDKVAGATEQLERAEDSFLCLIERFPHLIKEPDAIDVLQTLRTAIGDLSSLRRPLRVGGREPMLPRGITGGK
jgi:hypothetical protein